VPGRTLPAVAAAAEVDETVALSSIEQLLEADLLETRTGLDRRRFLRRTALIGGSAAALPLIQTVIGPLAQAAASPIPPSCQAIITKIGCDPQAHKETYQLEVHLNQPGTYWAVVLYKNNGSVTDEFAITADQNGTSISTHVSGASVPHDTFVTVRVYTAQGGSLICESQNVPYSAC
jgi:hypothetical protein